MQWSVEERLTPLQILVCYFQCTIQDVVLEISSQYIYHDMRISVDESLFGISTTERVMDTHFCNNS